MAAERARGRERERVFICQKHKIQHSVSYTTAAAVSARVVAVDSLTDADVTGLLLLLLL